MSHRLTFMVINYLNKRFDFIFYFDVWTEFKLIVAIGKKSNCIQSCVKIV